MKHGKKPTSAQRKQMKSAGCNPENWLISKDLFDCMLLVHRNLQRTKTIYK